MVTALNRAGGWARVAGRSRAVVADLAQPQRLAGVIDPPRRLDALVHCAGISVEVIAPVADTGQEVWEQTMAINVIAAAELTRLMLPALRRAGDAL